MVEVSWELEFTTSIPPSKVFKDFVIGFFDFIAKNVMPEDFRMKFDTLEGDGGVGSIKLMSFADDQFSSVKYKVKVLDVDNFTYSLALLKEGDEGQRESTITEMKVVPSADGGCIFKQKNTYFEETSEDEIEGEKEQLSGYFKAFEASVDQDSDDP